jgi:hypothetical protein
MAIRRHRANPGFTVTVAIALAIASATAVGPGARVARAACAPPAGHSATLLAGGRVLVTVSTEAQLTDWAQIYDPAADHWTPTAIQRDGIVVATLLADGRVLLTGDQCDRFGPQIYDPRTDAVSTAGVMAVPNSGGYTTTLLHSGKVLFSGGSGGPIDVNAHPENFAQLYDPATNGWSFATPTLAQRFNPQSLLLADGRVLVAGGSSASSGPLPFFTGTEIYDPATGAWSSGGEIATNGYGSAALAALGNGKAVAAGGGEAGRPTTSTELLDPSARTWSPTGPMTYARSGAMAMTLADGSALVLGGQGISGAQPTTAERFDPATGKWAVLRGAFKSGSMDESAIPLKDGRVFVAAWPDLVFGQWSTAAAQVFDPMAASSPSPSSSPTIGAWSSLPDAVGPFGNYSPYGGAFSSSATATALTDGRVLLIGTSADNQFHSAPSTHGVAAAIYDPTSGQSHLLSAPASISPVESTATLLRSGKVLVVGEGAYLYDPTSDTWTAAGSVLMKRFGHMATMSADGRVLVAGGLAPPQGDGGDVRLTSSEIYDPASNRWSAAADIAVTLGDSGNTGTLLRDGSVLLVSGYSTLAALYDPKSNRWSPTIPLSEPPQVPHTATLLAHGKVLVLGGCAQRTGFGCSRFAVPQLFDPAKNAWSPAAPMPHVRESFSATLLRDGLVFVAGGYGPQWVVASADLYDPTSNSWASAPDMQVARAGPTATLLRSGSVLVVGGSFLGNMSSAELYRPPGAQASAPANASSGLPVGLSVLILSGAALLAALLFLVAARRRRKHMNRIGGRAN